MGWMLMFCKEDRCSFCLPPAPTLPQCSTNTLYFNVTDDLNGCTQLVFIRVTYDGAPPNLNCPAPIVKNTDTGQCSAVVTDSDNCGGITTVTQTNGFASGPAFPTGTNVVNWQAMDVRGNSTSRSFTVAVSDNQKPAITCPGNIVKSTDPGQCSAVTIYATPTFSDNCSQANLTRTSGQASGSAFPKGVNNVVFKATDAAGNQSLCTMTVIVTDAQLPAVACPANIAVTGTVTNGVCSATVTYANPTATDNCRRAPI